MQIEMNRHETTRCAAVLLLLLLAGCGGSGSEPARRFISVGTAPVGGAFYTIGGAIGEVVNEVSGDSWQVTAESTGGTMENIRRLEQGDIQFAMANSSITYFAVRGEEGWEKKYNVKSVMTLFPNVAMFVTRADSGIRRIADLKGKRVYVGPEGAGFEYFVKPLVQAHGLTYDDLSPVYASQQSAGDYLGDGSVVAAFLGGAVPTASITSAAATMDILLVPYGEEEKKRLVENYPFFEPATIPANTYRGQDAPYHGLNVGSAHLITAGDADEETVYQFTRIVYENRQKIADKHRAASAINARNVVGRTGTDFHSGAIRYYREIGIWPERSQ